jgi:outer membrane protein OmpA-like peptidoglycan-associated protein/tetratricopeptide (TPR) repeat protein
MRPTIRLFLIALVAGFFGSCVQVRLRTANDNFAQFAYAPAAQDYEYVLKKRQDPQALANISESYRQMGNSVKTEYWYSKAVQLPGVKAEWYLYLAEAMMKNGKCESAKKHFATYLEYNRNDYRAQRLLNACDSLLQFYRDTTLFEIAALRFNTPGENYLSPIFHRNGIVFLSDHYTRGLSTTLSDGTGKRYLDFYYAKKTARGNWLDPEPLRGNVNGRYNEGPSLFTHNDSVLIFTRNNYLSNTVGKNKYNINVLKLFEASFVEGEWIIQKELKIGNGDYSIAHPALSKDGQRMYFISDMPWGYGGTDIYFSQFDQGNWSEPVNLGATVNTEGNEAFPFLWNDTILYYASDGLNGMGGFDVYETILKNGEWKQPVNLGVPVNSCSDDFSLIVDSTGMAGYFTSTRGGQFDKIYSFTRKTPQLSVTLKAISSEAPVQTVSVKLMQEEKVISTAFTDLTGQVNFLLEPGNVYTLVVSHREYYQTSVAVSTIDSRYSANLSPVVNLKKVELNKSTVVDSVFFKKKDWQLKLESAKALDKLATFLKNNPHLQVEIGAYTDSRGSDGGNLELTQRRAEIVQKFLASNGVSNRRVAAKGYGESKLRNKCVNGILCIEEEHEVNNRIELTVRSILSDTGL